MQLKHVPYCFVVLAAVCLVGAMGASATPAERASGIIALPS